MNDPYPTPAPPSALQGCLRRSLRGVFRQLAIVVGVLVLWGSCVAVGVPVLMFLQAPSDVAFLVTFIGGMFVTLTIVVGGVIVWRVRLDRSVDAAFAPLGLEGRMFMISGRRHEGVFQGARVESFYYRGPVLDIYLYAPFGAQATFAVDNALARAAAGALKRESIAREEPALAGFRIIADDEPWLDRLLADGVTRDAVVGLLRTPEPPGSPLLQFQADRILLRFAYADIRKVSTERLHSWLEAMAELARRLTELPPPKVAAKPQLLDQKLRSSPLMSPWVMIGIAVGTVAFLMVCGLVSVGLVLALGGGL